MHAHTFWVDDKMRSLSVPLSALVALLFAQTCNASDWAFGIFVRDKGMLLHGTHTHTANTGVAAFAASFLNRTSAPRLAMLVDEGTGAALERYCAWDGSKRCLLLRPSDVLAVAGLPSGGSNGLPRFLAAGRASLFIRRWWLYLGMMELARRVDPDAGAGMALVTDVRDVLWQDDVFSRLRSLASSAGVRSAAGEHPLFFAVEPFNGTVKDEKTFNVPCAAECMPAEVQARFAHMPLSCAGTTGGSWAALQAYARVMQAHTLFCAGLGKKFPFEGMDQPMHMYALYDTILGRQGEAGWEERYGRLFTPEARASYPLHPRRDSEPAYAALANVSKQYFDGQGQRQGQGQEQEQGAAGGLERTPVRIIPVPVYHDEGAICTLSLIPWQTFSPPRDNGFADILTRGKEGGLLCALVHQYDRHARLVKLVDVKYAGLDPAVNYLDSTTGETY